MLTYLTFLIKLDVNAQVIVFTVLSFSKLILKPGFKNKDILKILIFVAVSKILLLLILGGLKPELW